MKARTYKLRITSWAERSSCGFAEHFYGRVRFNDQEVDLDHIVDAKDPAYYDSSIWRALAKPGTKEKTIRFKTRDEILQAFRNFLWSEAKPTDSMEISG
jgi:hypothetical protein